MVLIAITSASFTVIFIHMKDINSNIYENVKDEGLFPKEFYIWILFTVFCVFLPYAKSYPLRYISHNLIKRYLKKSFVEAIA